MILWRISIVNDLNGIGGEISTGRWHTQTEGKRIVYLAEHPALALVESLVNLRARRDLLPDNFQLMKVEVAPEIAAETLKERTLPGGWRESFEATQILGDEWLTRQSSALLSVPSAPSPESNNYLLNPKHPDAAKISVAWSRWIRYDRRLFRLSE